MGEVGHIAEGGIKLAVAEFHSSGKRGDESGRGVMRVVWEESESCSTRLAPKRCCCSNFVVRMVHREQSKGPGA